ncbi:MAG: ATP-binding protein [Candidatus Scalindua sp.]
MELEKSLPNPFRPGAGHMPPYLAGRKSETNEFIKLLSQQTILENMVLTGLRGVGKTVLLESFKPSAIKENWLWVGTDLSESVSVSEANLATRLIADLSVITSNIVIAQSQIPLGFSAGQTETKMSYKLLANIHNETPGLMLDKLKTVLEFVWNNLKCISGTRGVIFAYDEAQNLSDQSKKGQYPLGNLLDLFQSIQRKGIPFMLLLTGLPTLFPKLVDSRTFAERMFTVVELKRLEKEDSQKAILEPIKNDQCPVVLSTESVELIIELSAGYPYFIQFICKEVYDLFLSKLASGQKDTVPVDEITRKLDTDFFTGRWSRATDRQKELLFIIAKLVKNDDEEFSVQEIVELAKEDMDKPFSSSHVNQMLVTLTNAGLIYKNRYGKYSFAVPLLGNFILRQHKLEK